MSGHGGPTRRDWLRLGAAALSGGLLAGCAGGAGSAAESTASADPDGSYSVRMAPAGEVAFDGVPRDVMVYSLLYADAAVACGRGDAVNSLGFDADAGGRTLDAYYRRLDGVDFDRDDLTQLNTGTGSVTVDKELFYALDSDLHLVDPCLVLSFDGWDRADVDEITETVGPWFGNAFSRTHARPPEGCRDEYRYYTLPEITDRVGAVFREGSRMAALATVREELLERVRSALPPPAERPTVGSVIFMADTFYPSRTDRPGFANAHVRPLGATDAFAAAGETVERSYDYEAMLEVDPDVLLHRYGIASHYDVAAIRETLADHPVASGLTAVADGRVYPSAHPVQGPIMNLFQIEMTAKQLYPDRFGAWPDYADGEPYPEIPADERLFDRERVAGIVTGGA